MPELFNMNFQTHKGKNRVLENQLEFFLGSRVPLSFIEKKFESYGVLKILFIFTAKKIIVSFHQKAFYIKFMFMFFHFNQEKKCW